MLQAPTLHTAVYAFFRGRAYRPPFLQGSLAPGRVTVLSPLPASQSPTGSPCLWIRESMASLFSRGKAFRLGWGRGSFREAGCSPAVLRTLLEVDVLCWMESWGQGGGRR